MFEKALRVKLNGDAYWNYVHKLRGIGTRQTFLIAKRLCLSHEKHSRTLGIDVLCQLRHYDKPATAKTPGESKAVFRKASIRLVRPLLRDRRIDVFLSAIYALGHLNDTDKSRWISRFSRHRDRDVRYAVTYALGGDEKPLAVRTLIRLSADEDAKVRDWATFGIGDLMEKDSPEIREALFRRVRDRYCDPRGEALVGLAKRKDKRVIDLIMHDLQTANPRGYALIAAEEFGNPVFLPALEKHWHGMKRHGKTHSSWCSYLQDAIKACAPRRGSRGRN